MKLPSAYETEMFINQDSTLTIKQDDFDCGSAMVVLTRDQAVRIAQEIMRLAGDGSDWPAEVME